MGYIGIIYLWGLVCEFVDQYIEFICFQYFDQCFFIFGCLVGMSVDCFGEVVYKVNDGFGWGVFIVFGQVGVWRDVNLQFFFGGFGEGVVGIGWDSEVVFYEVGCEYYVEEGFGNVFEWCLGEMGDGCCLCF